MSPARESTLPAKEKQHFHKLVKCYEQKQFKQGLKYAKDRNLIKYILVKVFKSDEKYYLHEKYHLYEKYYLPD